MHYILNDYYNSGQIKFGDLINSKFSIEQRKTISEFQVYKYLWRFKEKNGKEDLIKARYYLDDLIGLYNDEPCHQLELDLDFKDTATNL